MPAALPGKILFVELVGRGEFLWNLPLARALTQRGHTVEFLTVANHEADCLKAGVTFREWVASPRTGVTDRGRRSQGGRLQQGIHRWRDRAAIQTAAMRDLFELVQREFRDGPLLVAARHNALGARLAHEKIGVPLVGLYPTPAALRTCYHEPGLPIPEGDSWPLRLARGGAWWSIDQVADHFLLPALNGYRRELGLPAIRRPFHRWVESPGLNVGLFPECFAPIQPDWPENLVVAGFPVASAEDTGLLPPSVARFLDAGDAPIVFTRGSHVDLAPAFFAEAVEICRHLGRRGLLAGSAPGFDERSLPSTVFAAGFVPFEALLPRAAGIVHHGGIGTTALALTAGIPQVVTPMFDDQFYNARRVTQLGVGCRLARRDRGASRLAQALDSQLTAAHVRARCHELALTVRRQARLEEACRAIERYGVQSASFAAPGS